MLAYNSGQVRTRRQLSGQVRIMEAAIRAYGKIEAAIMLDK